MSKLINPVKRTYPTPKKGMSQRFDCGPDEWTDRAFLDAVYFTTFRMFSGRHRRDVRRFSTFKEAVDDATPDPRALVYAVTQHGRQACLDRNQWDHFFDLLTQNE